MGSHADDTRISFQQQARQQLARMETFFFICLGGDGSTSRIYSQPSIDERQVPATLKDDWNGQQQTLADWRLAFRAVENADDSSATIDEIKKQVASLNNTSNFRTP